MADLVSIPADRVGPGARPGGGVTGAPTRNAVEEILADRKKRRLGPPLDHGRR